MILAMRQIVYQPVSCNIVTESHARKRRHHKCQEEDKTLVTTLLFATREGKTATTLV